MVVNPFRMHLLQCGSRRILQIPLRLAGRSKRKVKDSDFAAGRFFMKGIVPVVGGCIAICEVAKLIREDRTWRKAFNLFPVEFVYVGVSMAVLAAWQTGTDFPWLNSFLIKVTPDFFSSFHVWILSAFSHNSVIHWAVNTYCGWTFARGMNREQVKIIHRADNIISRVLQAGK